MMEKYISKSINGLKTIRKAGYNAIATLCIVVTILSMWMMATVDIDFSDYATQRPELIAGALIIACMVMVYSFLITHRIQRWRIADSVSCIVQTIVVCAFVVMSLIQTQNTTTDTIIILPTHLKFIDYAFSYSIIAMMGIMYLIIIDCLVWTLESMTPAWTKENNYLVDSYNRDDVVVCILGVVTLILLYRYSVYGG